MSRTITVAVTLAVTLVGVAGCKKSPTAPTPDCSLVSLTPITQTFTGGGGTGTISVATGSGCAWTAASSASWVVITGGGSGTGQGAISFTVSVNPGLTTRNGGITVGGIQSAIAQAGTPNDSTCRFELRPPVRSAPAAGVNFLVQVFTTSGCRWEYSSNLPWLQIVPESEGAPNGNGSGSVEAHVLANPDPAPRTGQALIAGLILSVTQDGQSSPACTYGIAPATVSANAIGAQASVSITTGSGCSWWVEAEQGSVGWITFTSGERGFGPATVPYLIQPNQSLSSRTANVVVHGDSGNARLVQKVTQSAAGCLYTITPSQVTFTGDGTGNATASATVATSPGNCSWTAATTASWVTVVSPSLGQTRTGAGTFLYQVAPNTSVSSRSAEVLVAGLSGLNPPARMQVTQTPKPF